ncbi:hypothetical protein N7534_003552 [Penicillium rubens]|jgi:hypothetical protein|nr:hypothetical protein N7524_003617 [Penicillium chrysogenum]KAJ5858275.1 hypothetical protein N7534_003552 [Penicillium rubens]
MASKSGVNKSPRPKERDLSHLVDFEERVNNNSISYEKVASGAAQASVSYGRHPVNDSPDGGQGDRSGPTDLANFSPPSDGSVVPSIERDATPPDRCDTQMPDAGLADQTEAGPRSSGHQRPSTASHSQNQSGLSPNSRGDNEPKDPELLATLDPSDDGEETDAMWMDGVPYDDQPLSSSNTDLATEPDTRPSTEMDIPMTA